MNLNKNKRLTNIKPILSRWGFSKKGLVLNTKGEWYFFSQILIIVLHAIPPYPKFENIPFSIKTSLIIIGLIISINGLIITIQALIDLGDNLTPLPYPMKNSNLIQNNSYQKTRHPLYKGLIFISLGICFFTLSIIHIFLLFSLAHVLKIKAIKEEERLKIIFPEYDKYIEKVPAIIKGINFLDWRS